MITKKFKRIGKELCLSSSQAFMKATEAMKYIKTRELNKIPLFCDFCGSWHLKDIGGATLIPNLQRREDNKKKRKLIIDSET